MRKPWWMDRGSCFSCRSCEVRAWVQPCFGCILSLQRTGWEKDHWWRAVWRYLRWLFRHRRKEDEK